MSNTEMRVSAWEMHKMREMNELIRVDLDDEEIGSGSKPEAHSSRPLISVHKAIKHIERAK